MTYTDFVWCGAYYQTQTCRGPVGSVVRLVSTADATVFAEHTVTDAEFRDGLYCHADTFGVDPAPGADKECVVAFALEGGTGTTPNPDVDQINAINALLPVVLAALASIWGAKRILALLNSGRSEE